MITAADVLSTVESNILPQYIRKRLIEDMPEILDAVSNYKDATIIGVFSNWEGVVFKTSVYERIYDGDLNMFSEEWLYPRGRIPETEPSVILYYSNGLKRSEEWRRNGGLHRDGDKPAHVTYFENGVTRIETWYVNNVFRRDGNKPALVIYYENGNPYEEGWSEDTVQIGEIIYVKYDPSGLAIDKRNRLK